MRRLRIQIPDIKITLKSIQHLKDMKVSMGVHWAPCDPEMCGPTCKSNGRDLWVGQMGGANE